MSDEQSAEYLNLLKTTFDTATDIARAYIDTKIIQKDFNSNFVQFVEQNKHDFFSRWNPQKTCCCCQSSTFSRHFEQFDKKIFTQIYSIDYTVSCKSSKPKNGLTKCVCQIIPKQDVSLECLDIGALACITKQYGKVDVNPLHYINKVKEVRNELCHATKTDAFTIKALEDKWTTIETAMNGLLDEIGMSIYLRKIYTERIQDIKKDIDKGNQKDEIIRAFKREFGEFVASVNISSRTDNPDQPSENKPKRLKIDAESQTWDEDKVISNINKYDQANNPPKDGLQINSIMKKCVRFDLTAASDVFTDKEKLEKAIDSFIKRLIDAGDIDVSKPGLLELNITVISPLTKEEKQVVMSVFGKKETSAMQGLTNEGNKQIVPNAPQVDPDMSVELQSQTFSLYFVDIPEHLGRFVEMSEAERSKNMCVQWSFDCPPHWNISDLVDDMNKNMVNLKGWFKPMLIFQDKETGRLVLQCNTQCQLFSSYQQFELEVRNFIELIEDKCQLQTYSQTHGDKREDVGINLSVIMPPDGYLLEDDPKNLISETEKEPVHGKRTDLDETLLRLGVKQCLEIKRQEYNSKIHKKDLLITVQSAFYSHLKELARKRKKSLSLSTKEVIRSIQSNLPQAVSEFPELDAKTEKRKITLLKGSTAAQPKQESKNLFGADKYIYSCGNCSSSDVICWCKICEQLYCFHCLAKHHKDISHAFVFDDHPSPVLTFIKQYDIKYGKERINDLYDMELLDGKLIILGKCYQQLKLILWKDDVLDSKLVDDNHDNVYCKLAVIDSHTCVVQTKMLIIIFTINNSMINELLRIQMDKECCTLAHVNGILYVGTGSGIIKMTLEGNKVGEIKCENLQALYANGTQIYYTTYVEGQYVNVIETTKSDTMRSLDSFRNFPDKMEFTSNGNIVFLKQKTLWFTCDEGQCNYILISFDKWSCFSLSNDEIYSATKYSNEIRKYKLNEEMLTQLTQSMSRLSTSSGTSFQKSLQDPGISTPVSTGVSVPVTSVSIAQTTTAEEQGGVVNPDIETPKDPGFSAATLRYSPMDLSSSQMKPMPVLNQQRLQQERNTTLPVGESYLPFTPLKTFPPGEEPYHQPLPELGQPFLQHRNFQAYDLRREGPVNPAFEVPGSSNALQNVPPDLYLSQMGTMPVFGHQSLPQERDTQRESSEGFQPFSPQISYSDVAFGQFYSNPGPSQPNYFAPPVHTYGRLPHLPPGDGNITNDEDLIDESGN